MPTTEMDVTSGADAPQAGHNAGIPMGIWEQKQQQTTTPHLFW